MRLDLVGPPALVTGGAGGIGAAVARELAQEGARVIILDRDLAGAEGTCEAIRDVGGTAHAIECDLEDHARLEDVVGDALATWGPITAVCLNAGIGSLGTVETLLLDEWRRTLAVNLEANLLILRHLLDPMRDAGGGSIVAVSSLGAASAGHPSSSPAYGVSKAGLERLVLDVAQRCATDGIRANSVRPGPVATNFVTHRLPGPGEHHPPATGGLSTGRVDPAEIAAIIAFLLSDRARLITGQTITADGGFTYHSH